MSRAITVSRVVLSGSLLDFFVTFGVGNGLAKRSLCPKFLDKSPFEPCWQNIQEYTKEFV